MRRPSTKSTCAERQQPVSDEPTYVMDSGALLAYLRDEEGAATVERICQENRGHVYMHAVNAGEIYYVMQRDHGDDGGRAAIRQIMKMGVVIRDDMDTPFWQDAMHLKATERRVSLADCYFLALTRRLNGIGLTTDHHEMDPLVPLKLCTLQFLR